MFTYNSLLITLLCVSLVVIVRLLISHASMRSENTELSNALSIARGSVSALQEVIDVNEPCKCNKRGVDQDWYVGDLVYSSQLGSYGLVTKADEMTGVDVCTDLYGNEVFPDVDVDQLELIASTMLSSEVA